MEKTKVYRFTQFPAEALRDAISRVRQLSEAADKPIVSTRLEIGNNSETWNHDTDIEFLADYRKSWVRIQVDLYSPMYRLFVMGETAQMTVAVTGPNRADIESVFEIFDSTAQPITELDILTPVEKPVIFIGHGRSSQWRELRDHLRDLHGYKIEAYEAGARAGHTIRDILEEMASNSSFALLVLTAEDMTHESSMRARQNVIHEAGLFQGRLGFSRAIMLIEEGVEEFSNVAGVQYIRFSAERIREAFGDVLATIGREFGRSPTPPCT